MDKHEVDIASLVEAAQAGDSSSVGRLFELLSNRIYRFFSLRTSDRETAQDLTQTVFLEMIQALPRYKKRRSAKFTTWLFQLARFRLIDHYRKQRPSLPIEDAPEPSHEPFTGKDPIAAQAVTEALRKLPEKYQTVLHLKFREGFSAGEIAQVMRTTALNVRVMQFRALRDLRTILTKSSFHENS